MNMNTSFKNIHIDNNDSGDEETQMNEDDDEPDFFDENSGKCWEFGSKIEDEKHLKEWCQNKMGGMIVGKEEKLTRQFHCQIKQCQFKAIFLKSCSTIYTRNQHNHAMEIAKNSQQKKGEKKSQNDYVDQLGKLWSFHANIGKDISNEKLINKFGFTGIHNNGETTLKLRCTKVNPDGGRCPFAGIYLKLNGCLYTRGEHEHTTRGKTPQNIGDDYLDIFGKIWPFHLKIGKHNVPNRIWRNRFGFSQIYQKQQTVNLHCHKRTTNGVKCPIKGIYVKANGCLYILGKHEHK